MNLKKNFLTLSIKHQISFVISIISIMCLLLVLALFSLYGNIIINTRSRIRQEYFYERYKKTFDSQINFQNFLLYQYEQLLKLFNEQLYYYSDSVKDLSESYLIGKSSIEIKDYSSSNEDNTTIEQYYKHYLKNKDTCDAEDENVDFTKNYIFLYNHLNTIRNLKVLYLGVDGEEHHILQDFILLSLICNIIFSNNKTKISEIIANNNNLNKYRYR